MPTPCFRWRTSRSSRCCRKPLLRFEAEEDAAAERPLLLQLADEVQDAVRRRVDERTWQVFWNVAVLGQSVREASEAAGISYYAAFAAQKRVRPDAPRGGATAPGRTGRA